MASTAVAAPQRWGVRLPVAGAASALTLVACSATGVAALLYPFLLSEARLDESQAHAGDAPLVFAAVLALSLVLFVAELSRERMSAKTVSLLAVTMVAAAALRVPVLPAGASAFFFLVIVGGYVFGPRLGFLQGAGALLLSAFVTGGLGPWLPFQMFATGWMGMSAGWLGMALGPRLRRRRRVELCAVAAFGALWGFLFGAIMNLWFWPFVAHGESISWRPGMGALEAVRHYWSFYLLTSAGWDAWRAMGNAALLLIAGGPVIELLRRYRDRFRIALSD